MPPFELVTSRLRRAVAEMRHFPAAWRLVWTAARPWTLAWTVLLVAQGVLPLALVFFTRRLVDALAAAVRTGAGSDNVRPVVIAAVWIAVIMLVAEILRGITSYVRTAQSLLVQDHISGIVHRKSLEVDLALYDSPEFYDRLHRARVEGSSRPLALIESLGAMVQNLVTFVAMAAVLLTFGVLPLIALAAAVVPILYVVLRVGLREYAWRLENTERERRTHYYDWLMTAHVAAAELRLFGLGRHFRHAFQQTRFALRTSRMQLARDQFGAEMTARVAGLLIGAAAIGWMGWRAFTGVVSLGALAMFYQAYSQATSVVRSMLENVTTIHRSTLYLGDLFDFLATEPSIQPSGVTPSASESYDIRFENVTFRYPGTDRDVLRGVNLALRSGKIAAIVGPNGSGKSTLLKLACRLYDPQHGSVSLNGTPLTALEPQELQRLISVAFQETVHFAETARDNLHLGDVASANGVDTASDAAGATEVIAKLPQGYDTLLSRWFSNGAELSVGEWQRIGLGRAFYRDAPIMILDEPTSAMDPWAEARWAINFREFARGRTVLLITHRFSTARFADVIYVMDRGRVAECGTHDELLARDGLYARAWHTAPRS